ncbi:E1-E2 ATPase-domain-containing protein [Halteromyces radiatus]|uniref:E1-E2 ATPase-domain-containing protein n=1 Tax=Halteromyces radiatus TaxID=101107 RepID=UPI00221EC26D|nr:E1-E2 ATPase-domain-containing protein [Halteromyces radiatus]KAI8084938.1 E1-E2 ATPase-domain-containing protein [Halteromyces radiatus]
MTIYHIQVSVAGMTCQHCVKAVTEGLDQLPEVTNVMVNLDKRQATLDFNVKDTTKAALDSIKDLISRTIEELGYDSGTPYMFSDQDLGFGDFLVEGMTCSSCVHSITTALSDSPLVLTNSLDISLDSHHVRFKLNQHPLTDQDKRNLVALIDDLGYTVVQATFLDNNGKELTKEDDDKDNNETTQHIQSATFPIVGMTCSHCVRTVTTGLQSLPGVIYETVQVNLDKQMATLAFENDTVTIQILVDTIQELGYDIPQRPRIVTGIRPSPLVPTNTTSTTTTTDNNEKLGLLSESQRVETSSPWSKVVMRVNGMTCESCVASLTSALSSLENVQMDSVFVDLATDMAMMICKEPNVEMIRATVENRGYQADNIQIIHNLKQPAALWETNHDDDKKSFSSSSSLRSLRKTSLGGSVVSLGAVSVISPTSVSKRVTMNVSGMTCSSCVRTLEKALAKLPSVDVNSIKVNLLVGSATFNIRGDVINDKDISEAVEHLGYVASNISMVVENSEEEEQQQQQQQQDIVYAVSLIISGMYCESCVDKVKAVIAAMPGIKKSSILVDLDSGCASFLMDSDMVTRQRVYKEIQQLGFAADSIDIKKTRSKSTAGPEVADDDTDKGFSTTRLTVTGMTCSSCVANIERVMLKQPGIQSCQVNLLAKSAVIVHDPSTIGARVLANMIEQIGYKAELAAIQTSELSDQRATMRETMQKEIQVLRSRFLWSLLFAIPTVLISMIFLMAVPSYGRVHQVFIIEITGGLTIGDLLLFLLATPVQFWLGSPFYKKAWKSLYYTHSANMETLVALGTTVAYLASVGSVIAAMVRAHQPHYGMDNGMGQSSMSMNYFETSVLLITFIHLGKWLEALAKGKTAETITKLMDLQPEQAIMVQIQKKDDKEVLIEEEIDSKDIQVGDIIKVNAGGRIPCDGKLWRGSTTTDESMITGESVPVSKQPGDSVISATINMSSPIYLRALRVGSDTTLSRIIQLVQDAQASPKAPIEQLADKISSVFVPIVILLALITFITWQVLSSKNMYPSIWVAQGESSTVFSIMLGVSVLVIACPCGLGLASPTAVMVGTGVAARYGVLVKGGGHALEMANRITTVAFDKTGTLTLGKPTVTDDWLNFNKNSTEDQGTFAIWKILGKMASVSNHPLSKAIEKNARITLKYLVNGTSLEDKEMDDDEGNDTKEQQDWFDGVTVVHAEEVPGRGVSATLTLSVDIAKHLTGKLHGIRALNVFLGNQAWMDENYARYETTKQASAKLEQQIQWQDQGKSIVLFAASPVAGQVEEGVAHQDGCRDACACVVCHCSSSSICCSASRRMMLAQVAIADIPRPEAINVVKQLRKMGIEVWMVTGDNERTGRVVATQLGIGKDFVLAGVKPEQKADKIRNLQRRGLVNKSSSSSSWWTRFFFQTKKNENKNGFRHAVVAMVGDGINDSPALAQADVGISVGSATDIAIEAASIVLIRNNLMDLLTMYDISKAVVRRIRLNFFWAFTYNICAIPIAAGILYPGTGAGLPPYIAGLAMVASSISVVCSSLLLRFYRAPKYTKK